MRNLTIFSRCKITNYFAHTRGYFAKKCVIFDNVFIYCPKSVKNSPSLTITI